MKNSVYLMLCFILVCVIFVHFSPKNVEKQPENETKLEDTIPPSEMEVIFVEPVEEEEEPKPVIESFSYRLTSFWSNDEFGTGSCTGSGLCEKDFEVNDKGWYTYDGKLVLAAATYECLNAKSGACGKWNIQKPNKTYYHYWDEIHLSIDGIEYTGIILDSCGASMYIDNEERIDLFVSGKPYAIDRGYRGNNPITLFKEVK